MSRSAGSRRKRLRRLLFLFLFVAMVLGLLLVQPWKPTVEKGSVLLLDLEGEYPERPAEGFLGRVFGGGQMSMIELLGLVRNASKDERISGMVVRVGRLSIGWAKAQEIRDALFRFRRKGKPLLAYLENDLVTATLEYYVASAAGKIFLPPGSSAPVTGVLARFFFLGGLWENLDVHMEVEKIGRYKTMGDMLARKSMSPAHREMAEAMLDSVYGRFLDDVAEARGLDREDVRRGIDEAPATPAELMKLGLADGTCFLHALRREFSGEGDSFLSFEDYRRAVGPFPRRRGGHKIAIVYATGSIRTGSAEGARGSGEGTASDTLVDAFRDAAEDSRVRAIVFRIDSPGGSALASDLIWHAVREAVRKKPVIASLSDVGASGGYYIAVGATKILARPATLTGSIGVVVAKPNVSGLLDRLGIHTETMGRGRYARLASVTDDFGDDGRRRIRDTVERVYDLFVDRVAAGRGLSPEQVDALGRGRVWTGALARKRRLVDELGGLWDAVGEAKASAGIPAEEEVGIRIYPRPSRRFLSRLLHLFTARLETRSPDWWKHLRLLGAPYDFPEGSVLTLMPRVIEIR